MGEKRTGINHRWVSDEARGIDDRLEDDFFDSHIGQGRSERNLKSAFWGILGGVVVTGVLIADLIHANSVDNPNNAPVLTPYEQCEAYNANLRGPDNPAQDCSRLPQNWNGQIQVQVPSSK